MAERTMQCEPGDGFHAAYAAPELQNSDRFVDWRCDLFSVGVIFYELLTLQLPYNMGGKAGRRQYAAHMNDKLILPSRLRPEMKALPQSVWQGIDRITARMLVFNPDGRYATPQAWLDDMDSVDFEIRRPSSLTGVNARFTRLVAWLADLCRETPTHG